MTDTTTTPAIAAENLLFRYGNTTAVNHINFTVAPGEILGFLGPNGSGKSTTVKLLTGQLEPLEGQARLLGQAVTRRARHLRSQIGVSFETTNLYEQMSAVENLELFASLFDIRHFDARALLEKVNLAGRGHERVERFSKGMKQRLMVARALVNRPKVLFLDEPTDGLDPVSSETIRSILREESHKGTTIFLCTHDMVEADVLSNRVAFIYRGEIVALDSPHALKQKYGRRALKAEVACSDGTTDQREVILDQPDSAAEIAALFEREQVITAHTSEATLEDIFIRMTGQGLL
jgi:ABC-type multidrug transport system ATPase subunit